MIQISSVSPNALFLPCEPVGGVLYPPFKHLCGLKDIMPHVALTRRCSGLRSLRRAQCSFQALSPLPRCVSLSHRERDELTAHSRSRRRRGTSATHERALGILSRPWRDTRWEELLNVLWDDGDAGNSEKGNVSVLKTDTW